MFDNSDTNHYVVAHIPINAKVILFVGVGDGNLVRQYLRRNPEAICFGVEQQRNPAEKAAKYFKRIIIGNLEKESIIKLLAESLAGIEPDALVVGNQFFNWRRPAMVLNALRKCISPEASLLLIAENRKNWATLNEFLDAGKQQSVSNQPGVHALSRDQVLGILASARFVPVDVTPIFLEHTPNHSVVNQVRKLALSLNADPENAVRNLSTSHWVIVANIQKPEKNLSISALGLRKVAGVTEARIDFPMASLDSLPGVSAVWSSEGLSVSKRRNPGVIVLHRQFLVDQLLVDKLEDLVKKGWVLTMDMDDDPHHWKEFVDSDFFAFKAVHAVTVSTDNLANMIRPWNSHVQVFPNAIFELPTVTMRDNRERIRVFFGALNRNRDWGAISDALFSVFKQLASDLEIVVVHDRDFFDSVPDAVSKEFHDTLPLSKYLDVMASCDIALLPLEDTPFNRFKSDLKFIECCAAQAVPICSSVVYSDNSVHDEIGVFADKPDEWQHALMRLCADQEEIRARKQRGLRYVKRHRMHASQVAARAAFYSNLIVNRVELEKNRQARLAAYFDHQ